MLRAHRPGANWAWKLVTPDWVDETGCAAVVIAAILSGPISSRVRVTVIFAVAGFPSVPTKRTSRRTGLPAATCALIASQCRPVLAAKLAPLKTAATNATRKPFVKRHIETPSEFGE